MPGPEGPGRLNRAEQGLLLLALLLPPLWMLWSRLAWVPGWASVDEAGHIAQLQWWREGVAPPWRLGWGCLTRTLQFGWLEVFGWRIESLRSFAVLLYLVESALLFSVAQAYFNVRAAVWALCANAFSALTFARLGSILWFPATPAEWLLMAAALLSVRGRWSALGWGAAAGLLLFEYDAWALGLPGLAALFWLRQGRGAKAAMAGLGFALGAAFVLWVSRDWLQATWAVRVDQSLPPGLGSGFAFFFQHLQGLLWGAPRALPYLGVPGHPQVAPWLWLGVLAVLPWWRQHWAWLLAALVPLLALALHAPAVEANRCLAAWPAFCILAGLGFSRLSQARGAFWLLLLWAGLGALWELRAQANGLKAWAPRFYAASWDQLSAGRWLRGQGSSFSLYSDLDVGGGAEFRFASGLAPEALRQGPAVVLMPWQDAPRPDASLGAWQAFQSVPQEAPFYLLIPLPKALPALQAADAELKALWPRYWTEPSFRFLAELERRTQDPLPDARVRTALWEARLRSSRYLGQAPPLQGQAVAELRLLRVDPLLREARRLRLLDPKLSLRLAETAWLQDPRRQDAWSTRQALRVQNGLQKGFEAAPPGLIWPGWLQD